MRFCEKLASNQPIITLEISPPKGTDVSRIVKIAAELKGQVDAINVPDCQRGILKLSALAASRLIEEQAGIECVWQLTCRDRNLIALQADLLGAWALGLRNVLALTGDPVQVGDQKELAKQVFHLESTRLLELINTLNKGQDAVGQEFPRGGTAFTVGAALNPSRLNKMAQQNRLKAKLERGVQFFQTQPVYSADTVEQMLEIVANCANDVGCPPPRVLIGMVPPSSARIARQMNQSVPGIEIPESFIDLLERSDDPKRESILFCAERIQQFQHLSNAFHFMPVGMESRSRELLEACFSTVS